MLKKVVLAVALICFVCMNFHQQQVEAKGNIFSQIMGVLNSAGSSSKSSRSTAALVGKRQNIELNGQYYPVYFDKSVFQKDAIAAESYFYLEQPAEVFLHYIGHTSRGVWHTVYDSDGNALGDDVRTVDSANDQILTLSPGKYSIKSKISSLGRSENVDFEIKGRENIIPVNVDSHYDRLTRYTAQPVYYASEITDYIPYGVKGDKKNRYYTFSIQTPVEIRLLFDKLSTECDVIVYLLDEDEGVIKSWYGLHDDHNEYNCDLGPGTYYIKIVRNSRSGGAYSFKIK